MLKLRKGQSPREVSLNMQGNNIFPNFQSEGYINYIYGIQKN